MERAGLPGRVLVLGGTGFLGDRIAREYLAAGSDVSLLTRRRNLIAPSAGGRTARVWHGRPQDAAALAVGVAQADHVVYAVGALNPAEAARDPGGAISRSIPMLLRVLECLRATPGVGLTYVSSGGAVYGEVGTAPASEDSVCHPVSAYGISKLTAERYVAMYARVYGVPSRIARVANAYGPGQPVRRRQGLIANLLDSVHTGRTVRIFGTGQQVRDYVYVDDVAKAIVTLSGMTDGTLVVNIGTGAGHSIREVVQTVEQQAGTSVSVEWSPSREFDVEHNVLDVARLAGLIGWRPTPLPVGIGHTYRAMAPAAVTEGSRSA